MDLYEAIKFRALSRVLKPNTEFHIRRLYRWYSKTFHTPLDQAYDIPFEYVLRDYFEEYFTDMEEEEREELIAEMLETEEQKKARLSQEEADAASERELMEMAKKANEEALKDKLNKISEIANPKKPKITEQIERISNTLKNVTEQLKADMQSDPVDLPEIDMKFNDVDDNEFEKLLNSSSVGKDED